MQPIQYLMTDREQIELYRLISRFWNRFPWKFLENHLRLKSYPRPMASRFSVRKITAKDFIKRKEQTISVSRQWILKTEK